MGNFVPEVMFHGRSETPPPPHHHARHSSPTTAAGFASSPNTTIEAAVHPEWFRDQPERWNSQKQTRSVFTADGTAFPLVIKSFGINTKIFMIFVDIS